MSSGQVMEHIEHAQADGQMWEVLHPITLTPRSTQLNEDTHNSEL